GGHLRQLRCGAGQWRGRLRSRVCGPGRIGPPMIKRLLALDGIRVVCRFRDDGAFVEGYGPLSDEQMVRLATFAHDYKRRVQGNADQLAMFTQMRGWTPPDGWMVRSAAMTVCSVGNVVCLVENAGGSLTEIMATLAEVAHW